MTVFFRYFFRERQKDNEINALHSTQNGLYDPLYRENRSFGISCHTPAVSGAFPPCQIHHARRCVRPFPLAHHKTPALAGVSSPSPNLSHLLKADVYSPSPFMERGWPTGRGSGLPLAIIPRQHCGRPSFPLSKYTTFASGRCLLPISNYITSASGRCLLPISIYGEGVADRPGGEVPTRHHPLRYPCFGKHR